MTRTPTVEAKSLTLAVLSFLLAQMGLTQLHGLWAPPGAMKVRVLAWTDEELECGPRTGAL